MNKKAVWAVCGTATIISATTLGVVFGGSVQVVGLLLTGLIMLLASIEPPGTVREGGKPWPQ